MLIYAHRGASKDAPENTQLAFDLALEQHSDGIELDVFEHQGKLWVIHDSWLDITTNGKGQLYDHSSAQLSALDAGQGQRIPTLEQVLHQINGRCLLNIEVKGLNRLDLLRDHIKLAIESCNFSAKQLLVSSFDHPLLQRIKLANPDYNIGALIAHKGIKMAEFASEMTAYSANYNVNCMSLEMVKDAHARGLKVLVYTVDRPEQMRMLQEWNVDGIFTNVPQKARQVLNQT